MLSCRPINTASFDKIVFLIKFFSNMFKGVSGSAYNKALCFAKLHYVGYIIPHSESKLRLKSRGLSVQRAHWA